MDEDFLDAVMEQWTGKLGDGTRKVLPRRTHDFVMPSELCRPGVFPRDFKVTIRELSIAEEQECIKRGKSDAIRFGYAMAQASVWKVEDKPLGKKKSFFFEAIGARGRAFLIEQYTEHIAGAEEVETDAGNE